jgi:hypothetical protein
MKVGVSTIWSPITVQLTQMWWLSICQAQGSPLAGSPKIETKYGHSPNSSGLSDTSARFS